MSEKTRYRDNSRKRVTIKFNGVAPAIADTLLSLIKVTDGVESLGSTSIEIPEGSILRITNIILTVKSAAAAAAFAALNLRQNPAGPTLIASVSELLVESGLTDAVVGASKTVLINIPEGFDFKSGQTLGLSLSAQAITNVVNIAIQGFEYK